jgi:heat shock protein HspQ
MNTDEMRQAMKTLKLFSDKERDYHAYQARQNYLREQRTIQVEIEQMQQELKRERTEKQAALQREQSLQEENERLKALLAQSGRTP